MVSHPQDSRFVPRTVPRGPALSRGSRLLFVAGLLIFGVTSIYTSIALLARVTPALFPGQTLAQVLPGPLSPSAIVNDPGAGSVFNRRINILVLGTDARPDQENDITLPVEERFKARTDTIMVASVDPATETTTFLSFPRDMVIDINRKNGSKYQSRINESFLEGLQNEKSLEAGAEQVQRDLKANFGIDTDYWVIMDFRGVARIVDAVGGIDIAIPEELAIEEWWYSDDDKDHRLISIAAGQQHLDGYMAVAFSRNRDPNDLARIQRQQIVIQAAVVQAFSQGIFSPGRWPGMWDAYRNTITTNVPGGRLPGYANLLRETRGRITTYSVADPVGGQPTVWDGYLFGAAVLYWHPENVRYWIARTFPRAEYASATVEIQNAAGPDGENVALAIGRFLEFEKALPTVYLGGDAPAGSATEIVVYGDERRVLAEDIADWLKLPRSAIRELPREGDWQPDVVLIVGADVQLPASDQRLSAGG